jgi:hypothetical protein
LSHTDGKRNVDLDGHASNDGSLLAGFSGKDVKLTGAVPEERQRR